jgi:hypothetical protein
VCSQEMGPATLHLNVGRARRGSPRILPTWKVAMPVDAQDLREKALRCRELLRTAVKQEVKDQLLEWADDFEAEAEAIENHLNSAASGADAK